MFMKLTSVRQFVTKPLGLMLVRILTMIGIASYLSSNTMFHLIWMAAGNFFAMLALAGALWDKSEEDRYGYYLML